MKSSDLKNFERKTVYGLQAVFETHFKFSRAHLLMTTMILVSSCQGFTNKN